MVHPSEFPGTNMLDYPFPLRDDVTVHLVLPKDLTHDEAHRLRKFLDSLVNDPECFECTVERRKSGGV
jgi:hypothetical protein